ncbi:MAG: prolyl oligopeptidase family serine peptidase [Pseudomonadota bacterium]
MYKIRFAGKALLFAFACACTLPAARALPVPVGEFFRPEAMSDASMSPDGAHIAMLVRNKDGDTVLAVMPSAGGKPAVVASSTGRDIIAIHWVNSKRLLYSVMDPHLAKGETFFGAGLHAINIDGSGHVQLVSHTRSLRGESNRIPLLGPNTVFIDSVHDEKSSDIYVGRYDARDMHFVEYVLVRLNTETGNTTVLPGPQRARSWLIDEAGVARVATTSEEGKTVLQFNDPKTGAWRKLAEYTLTSGTAIVPVLMTREGQLFVLANGSGNTRGLYRYDTDKAQLDPAPVVGLKQYDFNGGLILGKDRESVLGVRYETSEQVTSWLDAGMKEVQKKIDAALPSTINTISLCRSCQPDAMLVFSNSDLEPGYWSVYQASTGKLSRLGARMPNINPLQMSGKSMVRYTARDGLEIPAYLTLPKDGGGKNLPMVVLVHGGPYVRGGHMRWSPDAQLLASRGYAVLEPDYRGSTGYGDAYFKAGWKQWGLAMQDDVADGAQWAIKQGYADAKRICIAGASYGGYATLMGLINNPDLFKCGVEWAGVTDINLMYDARNSDATPESKIYGMPVLIGDPVADAAQLKATSPLLNAARIKQPLIVAHGGADRRVPIEHGKRFYDAVAKTNASVEWIEYQDEGHGWRLEKNNVDFWTRVDKFLDKQIGKP